MDMAHPGKLIHEKFLHKTLNNWLIKISSKLFFKNEYEGKCAPLELKWYNEYTTIKCNQLKSYVVSV